MQGMLWTFPLQGYPADLGRTLWETEQLDTFVNPCYLDGPPVLRLSAFLYNEIGDYEKLAGALKVLRTCH